jgi:hypothetical protein
VRELRKIKQLCEFLIFDVGDTLQRIGNCATRESSWPQDVVVRVEAAHKI